MSDRVIEGKDLAKVTADAVTHFLGFSADGTPALVGMDSMFENVFIAYYRRNDGTPMMVKPQNWTALQKIGEVAAGVVIIEGGKTLLIAPTEADIAGLNWSSAAMSGGAITTKNRTTAFNDWNGLDNTASIISKSTASNVTNTVEYAPGFCHLYSRITEKGYGLASGKWWLPSAGEMIMVYANKDKINRCLGLITGATQLREGWYWTSTEGSDTHAWSLRFSDGVFGIWYTKNGNAGGVRPVSTFF